MEMEQIKNRIQNYNFNFWVKFLCFLIFLPLGSFLGNTFSLVLIALLLIFSVIVSGVGSKKFIAQSLIYGLPVAAGIFVVFFIANDHMPAGLLLGKAAIFSLRFVFVIASGILFSLATDPIDFPAGFSQAKIPHRFGVALMVSYRMMPLLSKKMAAIVDAQRGRGASFGFNIFRSWDFFYRINSLVIPVIYNTLSMSLRLSDALISRGYNPYGKITFPPVQFGRKDAVLLMFSCTIFLFSVLI
ncbi:MAG: energy-coupling factor transporter transmembrane component T [Candidatus Paceibacterota bacterium]